MAMLLMQSILLFVGAARFIYTHVSLNDQPFSTKFKLLHLHVLPCWNSKSTIRLKIIRYQERVAGHFETIAPNVSQMAFIAKWYPLYSLLLHTLSRKFHLFRCTASIFKLKTILRQVHWMTPKWPWTLEGQIRTIYIQLLPGPCP